MKNLFVLLSLLLSSPSFALSVFVCEPEWGALASIFLTEKDSVRSATSAGQDPHQVQARPNLISQVRQADLIICTGSGLESGWLPALLEKSGRTNNDVFYASSFVERLQQTNNMDRALGDVHPEGNPHVHLSAKNIAQIAEKLAEHLIKRTPQQHAFYQAKLLAFNQQWQQAIIQWQEQAAPLKGLRVVAHHDEWPYLFSWLDITQVALLEPKPGLPPTPAHLNKLTQQLQQQPANRIIYAAHNHAKPSQWLAQKTQTCAVLLPFTVKTMHSQSLFLLFDELIATLLTQPTSCQ